MARSLGGEYGAWEQRRFWHKGTITVTEWWRDGVRMWWKSTLMAARGATTTDYCEAHYTRIYPDLPCPYCQELPVARRRGVPLSGETRTRP